VGLNWAFACAKVKDDICTYKGKQYTKEEFYKLYPEYDDGIFVNFV
jgi:hypothetical protein